MSIEILLRRRYIGTFDFNQAVYYIKKAHRDAPYSLERTLDFELFVQ